VPSTPVTGINSSSADVHCSTLPDAAAAAASSRGATGNGRQLQLECVCADVQPRHSTESATGFGVGVCATTTWGAATTRQAKLSDGDDVSARA
jgi:hypothetical protein